MSMLSKDQIKQKIQHYDIKTTDDIKDMFGEVIQEIIEAELDTHLGYDKNSKETKDTDNRDAMLQAVRPYGHRNLVKFH
ncbi:hypothetical protein [Enterococcus faecalis]|uniref:hypothetical protein n=1 Tax=Enterococcus faecalis TaxID=1351 RepID=UPI002090F244|nr:hypothetical protein [Enterococcus faecalis]MCO5542259.1 hypothetical protein [Enterococcus faecalis]